MKTIMTLLNNPLMVVLSSLVGATATHYLQTTAFQALYWFIPVFAIVICDLSSGIKAARFRGEEVRISGALRRTFNKLFCYASWIICCVALNERYTTSMCAWVGMGMIFLIEGISFFSNLLEPHGIKLSVSGILKVVGNKSHFEGLEDIVEKPEDKNDNKKDEGDDSSFEKDYEARDVYHRKTRDRW